MGERESDGSARRPTASAKRIPIPKQTKARWGRPEWMSTKVQRTMACKRGRVTTPSRTREVIIWFAAARYFSTSSVLRFTK